MKPHEAWCGVAVWMWISHIHDLKGQKIGWQKRGSENWMAEEMQPRLILWASKEQWCMLAQWMEKSYKKMAFWFVVSSVLNSSVIAFSKPELYPIHLHCAMYAICAISAIVNCYFILVYSGTIARYHIFIHNKFLNYHNFFIRTLI
jgi:hypothetical protein